MYVFLVWLHLLAAVVWIGGMTFLSLVLVPILRRQGMTAPERELFQMIARRFRVVVWTSVALLVTTGPLLLSQRGLSLWEPAGWPKVLSIKLTLVSILFALTATHDLVIGPRAAALHRAAQADRIGWERAMVAASPWVARLSLLLALVILGFGLAFARL